MTPAELTKQAFQLYDTIRLHSYKAGKNADYRKRLHDVGLKAFYRYQRRLRSEQNQNRASEKT
ncbi:MAG: hypothetical protein ACXWF8_07995 [Methylobacter sp.]